MVEHEKYDLVPTEYATPGRKLARRAGSLPSVPLLAPAREADVPVNCILRRRLHSPR